jgi:hypothetical protein
MTNWIKLIYDERTTYLWTMPIEIRYYFFTHIYKFSIIVWSLFLLNLSLLIKNKDSNIIKMYEDKEISKLYGFMLIFLCGSALAGVYVNLEGAKWIEKLNEKKIYNLLLSVFSLLFFF